MGAIHPLTVSLGAQRYRVERPWGRPWGVLPAGDALVSDVACLVDGRVLVLLRGDPCIAACDPAVAVLGPDGTALGGWGGDIIADGHMLAVAPDGRVWIVDRDAHQIIIFTPDGAPVATLGTRHRAGAPFNAPCDVGFAADGTAYVADGYGAARVHVFGPDLAPRGGWGEPGGGPGQFSTPHSVAVLPDGRVAVADRENDRVQVFAPDGRHLICIGDVYRPMSVSVDADGHLLVTDQVPRLSRFTADGALVGRCRPVLNGAHGMALGANGALYLSEINPGRLTRLAPL